MRQQSGNVEQHGLISMSVLFNCEQLLWRLFFFLFVCFIFYKVKMSFFIISTVFIVLIVLSRHFDCFVLHQDFGRI